MIEQRVNSFLERLSDNFFKGLADLVSNPKEYSIYSLKGVISDIRQRYETLLDWNYRRKGIKVVQDASGDYVMINRKREVTANCSNPPGEIIYSTVWEPV